MKNAKFLLTAAALVCCTIITQAQTAAEIVAKHIEALGGKEKLGQINTLSMESTMLIMGNDAPNKTVILNGKGYKSETEFNGSAMIQCLTDKGGWTTNPMGGGGAEPMPEDQYNASKDQIKIGSPFLDYEAEGTSIVLEGKEGESHKLKVTKKDKTEATFFIDANTYFITKAVRKGNMMGQEMDIITKFADYKKTEFGYPVAYTVEIDFGGSFQLTSTVNKVEINKPVDAKVFEIPK